MDALAACGSAPLYLWSPFIHVGLSSSSVSLALMRLCSSLSLLSHLLPCRIRFPRLLPNMITIHSLPVEIIRMIGFLLKHREDVISLALTSSALYYQLLGCETICRQLVDVGLSSPPSGRLCRAFLRRGFLLVRKQGMPWKCQSFGIC